MFLGPWDLPGVSGSLGSLWKPSAALSLQSDSGTLSPSPLCSPSSLFSSDPPFAPGNFLRPQKALGAFGSLQQPWVFSQTQGPCSPCSPSPPLPPLLLLAPSHPLSLNWPLRPSWGLRKPWEPSEAFSSLGSSVRLRGFAPLAAPTPLLPLASLLPLVPEPLWAPGTFLEPQEALGAFRSL